MIACSVLRSRFLIPRLFSSWPLVSFVVHSVFSPVSPVPPVVHSPLESAYALVRRSHVHRGWITQGRGVGAELWHGHVSDVSLQPVAVVCGRGSSMARQRADGRRCQT